MTETETARPSHFHECRDCGADIPAGAACDPAINEEDGGYCGWPGGGNAGCPEGCHEAEAAHADKPPQPDPTRPLSERTDAEVHEYVDDHIIMALAAADRLFHGDREQSEDHVRNRLAAISDSWPDAAPLAAHESAQRLARLRAAIGL